METIWISTLRSTHIIMNENESMKNSDEFDIPQVKQSYDNLFKQITKLEKDDVIVRSNCKFCMHPARIEAERKFEQGNRSSFSLVLKFFKDYEKEHPDVPSMNMTNVRTHLLNHYLQQEKKIFMREYGQRLGAVLNYKMDQDRMFEMLSATLELKLHEIASDATLDPLKAADTITKIVKTKLDVIAIQSRLRGEMETVSIITNAFQNVFFHQIKNEQDPLVKRNLIKCLDAFQAKMEGTILPSNE